MRESKFMFSENGKISEKQLRRMLVLTTFAGTIFVIPYLGARMFGKSVFIGLLVFFVMAVAYICGIYGIGAIIRKHNHEAGKPKWMSKALIIIQILRRLFHLVFYIILSIEILGEAQVPFMEGNSTNSLWNIFVVLPLILVALYGAGHNVEKMGRLYEMLFYAVFIPFIIMILFGLNEVDYTIFIPQLDMSIMKILVYAYALVSFLVPVEQYLYLSSNIKEEHSTSYKALIGTVLLTVILSLFILGIYGIHGGASKEMITVDIMRYIRLPFGVLERFDVLMVWFFMLGCFILICSSLFYAGEFFVKLKAGKKYLFFGVMISVSFLLVYVLPDYRQSLWLYIFYGALVDIPLSLILPIVENILLEEN